MDNLADFTFFLFLLLLLDFFGAQSGQRNEWSSVGLTATRFESPKNFWR